MPQYIQYTQTSLLFVHQLGQKYNSPKVDRDLEICLKAAVQCESYNGTLYKSLGHMERSKFS